MLVELNCAHHLDPYLPSSQKSPKVEIPGIFSMSFGSSNMFSSFKKVKETSNLFKFFPF